MRFLGVDFGARRIGLAVSDASGLLARPWRTIDAGRTARDSAAAIAALLSSGWPEPDDEAAAPAGVVVGVPRRLNGDPTDMTQPAIGFASVLGDLIGAPIHLQDERLSSLEADSRLAANERNWRARKEKLDAAAAAVILQDFLDSRGVVTSAPLDSE